MDSEGTNGAVGTRPETGRFKLPLYLRVPLLPVLGVEALLRQLANRLTSEGFPSLSLNFLLEIIITCDN